MVIADQPRIPCASLYQNGTEKTIPLDGCETRNAGHLASMARDTRKDTHPCLLFGLKEVSSLGNNLRMPYRSHLGSKDKIIRMEEFDCRYPDVVGSRPR